MKENKITTVDEGKLIVEYKMNEQDMKEILMFLIKYFTNKGLVGLQRENQIYHFNHETI